MFYRNEINSRSNIKTDSRETLFQKYIFLVVPNSNYENDIHVWVYRKRKSPEPERTVSS